MPIPLIPAIQAGVGIAQSIIGGISARKNQKKLENLKTPTYTPNQSIKDYYSKALQRFNVNPYSSAQYRMQSQNADRTTATGINALQNRRSAVGGISRLAGIQNDAMLNAGVAAEREQGQRFGQLGGATQMQAGDDRMAFQYNKIAPFEKEYNLLSQKAGAGNMTTNAGLGNIFGGLGSAMQMQQLDKIYGNGNQGNGNNDQGGGGSSSFVEDYLMKKYRRRS